MRHNTILLIEKDVEYIKKFCRFFENDYTILCSSDGDRAMELYAASNTDIDIVILDNNVQDPNHSNLLEDIRSFSAVPIIVFMDNNEYEPQIMAYRMGADDCVLRDTPFLLLRLKMESILKMVYGTESSLKEGILELDLDKRTLKVDEEYVDITIKEFDLLSFFMRNKYSVQSRNQIITAVWGINYEGSDRAVDSLVKKLRLKLKSASDYIHTAYGMGYYFEPPLGDS
ncbi:MAG: response regulator transcription factor [Clostridiales bacterium]|nr:response regulator transcription factor [Clostridiales bacterium]